MPHVVAPAVLRPFAGLHAASRSREAMPGAPAQAVASLPCCSRHAVSVMVAQTPEHIAQANELVERQYQRAGFLPLRTAANDGKEDVVTLLAFKGLCAVATLTLRFDGPQGLMADTHYREVLAQYRKPGRLLCEVGRFAVDTDLPVLDLLNPLLQCAWRIGRRQRGVTDLIVECHPRHAAFYKRLVGFTQAGGVTTCSRVGAPAVLLHHDTQAFDKPDFTAKGRVEALWHDVNTHAADQTMVTQSTPRVAAAY